MPTHQATYVYTIEVATRWSDMDALGHVNNSVFFTYFEQARIEWWKNHNLPHFSTQETVPVIVNASCTYLRPIVYPNNIAIKVFVAPPGRTSYECFYEMYSSKDSNVLYAEGSTKLVWVDRKTGRPTPLPDYLLQLFPNK